MSRRPPVIVQVDGARQLRRTLRKLGDDLGDLKAAHLDAATIAKRAVAAEAPTRTGKMRATIRASGTKTAGIVRVGNNRKSASGVRYAGVQNWGWPKRNIKANGFLSRGGRRSEPQWIRPYMTYLNQLTNQVKGK